MSSKTTCVLEKPAHGWSLFCFKRGRMSVQLPVSYIDSVIDIFLQAAEEKKALKKAVTIQFDAEGYDWLLTICDYGVIVNVLEDKLQATLFEFDNLSIFFRQVAQSIIDNIGDWYYFTVSDCYIDGSQMLEAQYEKNKALWVAEYKEKLKKLL